MVELRTVAETVTVTVAVSVPHGSKIASLGPLTVVAVFHV